MRKNYSNWREDLREVVDIESSEPETEGKSEVRIGDKKVDNKITINPVMKEAFGQIGALVLEVTEIGEEHFDDNEKKIRDIENLQNDKDTKEGRKPGKLKERTLTPGEEEEKEDIVKGMKKNKSGFKKRYGKDAKSVMYATATKLAKEELSISDQMKVSREYFNKRAAMSPDEKTIEKEKHAKARAKISAMHKKPDPYRARAGESD